LLTLARADAGRLAPERAPFDRADTIALVREQYAPAAAAAGITLRSETTSAPLVADEDLLVQLLVNLLENALAHTPAGGAITLGCRPRDEEVDLWVADSGEGIAPVHQERVFDRFYRVDAGRARQRGGAGLGLAICKAIVAAHGGAISLVSDPGSGTRIDISLAAGR
ncbi:MAG: sensor histidine kinase, partial [Thermomicrobiales bacterium]